MHAAPTQSGGAALAGWRRAGQDAGRAVGARRDASRRPTPCRCSCRISRASGRRSGTAATRGVFARMDARAGTAEMVARVMEGVAFSVRLAFEALQTSAGVTLEIANIGGGGARSDAWCQIRADALGIALRRTAVPDARRSAPPSSPASVAAPCLAAEVVATSSPSTEPSSRTPRSRATTPRSSRAT